MPYQFAHINTYSNSGGKKGDFKSSGCLGEAFRDEGYTKHIDNPKLPEILFGSRDEASSAAEVYRLGFKDSRGHKLRKDGKELLAGVYSWPPGTDKKKFDNDLKKTLPWLKQEYGGSLRCVVAHHDEPFQRGDRKGETHFHIHFFVVPHTYENMDLFHPGLKAKKDARVLGKNIFEQDTAYKRAMGEFQDKINRELGLPMGLVKERPPEHKERRLSRREQRIIEGAEKKAGEILTAAVDEAKSQAVSILGNAENTAAAAGKNILKKEKELKEWDRELEKRQVDMDEGRNAKLRDFKLPGIEGKEQRRIPVIGDVVSMAYVTRVWDYVSGFAEKLKIQIKENEKLREELKKEKEELAKEKTRIQTLKKQMDNALARLDGKYGEEKEFSAWKAVRDQERKGRKEEQGPGHARGRP